jgi:hypothetical protein
MAAVIAETASGHYVGSDGAPALHLRRQVFGGRPEHSRLDARDAVHRCKCFRVCVPHRVSTVETKMALGRGCALAERAEFGFARH